jgi:hypothetical protein
MYAVVTGASGGFGEEFARALASRGWDLCLASRRESRLLELKAELEKRHGVHVDVLPVDLADPDGPRRLHAFTSARGVGVLVNNAGTCHLGLPGGIGGAEEIAMLDLNVRALHLLTRLYLDDMVSAGSGRILTVSSLSAWMPVPMMSAYAAGKAYALRLSLGLDRELRLLGSPVRVSVVTPGYFNTGIAGTDYEMAEQGRPVPAFVDTVVRRFLSGKTVIIVGRDRVLAFLLRIVPRPVADRLVYASVRKTFSPRKGRAPAV